MNKRKTLLKHIKELNFLNFSDIDEIEKLSCSPHHRNTMDTVVDEDNDDFSFIELQTIQKDEPLNDDCCDKKSENVNQSLVENSISCEEENTANDNHDSYEDEESFDQVTAHPKKKKLKSNKLKKKQKSFKSGGISVKKILKKKKKKNAERDKSSEPSVGKKPKCEYPRLCSGCGHAYKTKQSFWNHKQRCAMLPQNNRNRGAGENGDDENGEFVRRKEYICAHCERPYRKKYNLQEHLKNTCRGKPCSKGRLQCWEEGCLQAFYKYVDLVQHVTLQHGQDLQIQKLQFPNFSAFNTWKTEESNSKFMYARKITGSKRFSNTKYHYFVCQFNHRNDKKNNNRKTNRRKSVNLVVPNYNCPSRIMVKECENQIQVTYISSHNHELNLSNVKYQPLEKETRTYIKTLLQLGVSPKKIKEHLQEGVENPEINSFLATKQHFLTLNRIKRMESKLKAKNRARQLEQSNQEKNLINDVDSIVHEDSFSPCEDTGPIDSMIQPMPTCSNVTTPVKQPTKKEPDEVVKSIETNLKKLRGYMHKTTIKERLSDRISKMIQDLCNECENMETSAPTSTQKRPRGTARKKKPTPAAAPPPMLPPQPQTQMPQVLPQQQIQQIVIPQQPVMQQVHPQQHIITPISQNGTVTAVLNNLLRNEKSFTPVIDENTDLLKPIYQPFNLNLLCLKSIDMYITPHELHLLKSIDDSFTLGWLCDAVVDSFLYIICQPLGNVLAADTSITQYVQTHQKVPDVWHCFNWNDIDTIFIPCNPSKKHWFLLVVLVKQSELQILDPANSYETFTNIFKKYASSINCWYNVLRNFLGILQCNVTSPAHIKQNDPSNCGVLVCWYVFQYINKRSLLDSVDPDIFRKYIYDAILSNSQRVE